MKIIFATHAYHKDWRIVLHPLRLKKIIESHQYPFDEKLLVINNIHDHERGSIEKKCRDLLKRGIVSRVLFVDRYLTDEVLESFRLEPEFFWKHNPYFSTAQLTALHFAQSLEADYLLHMAGDVWLERCTPWIPPAIDAFEKECDHRTVGFNLCRNIYRNHYPIWSHEETESFWLSHPGTMKGDQEFGRGFSVSDHSYILSLKKIDFDFSSSLENFQSYHNFWPDYATPCFEMYFKNFLDRKSLQYAALKPNKNAPITKHKNFSPNQWKNLLYLLLGKYTKGAYASKCSS